MRKLCLLALCACSFPCISQTLNKDSLYQLLANSKEDTNRVNWLNALSRVYAYNYDADSTYYFASIGLDLARRLGDLQGQARSLSLMSSVMDDYGNYPEALKLQLKALEFAEHSRDQPSIADALTGLGGLYYDQKEYQRALDYYTKALVNSRGIGNSQEAALTDIGDTYLALGKLDSALDFSSRAYQLSSTRGNMVYMSDELTNLGEIYAGLGRNDWAHAYYRRGMDASNRASNHENFCVGSLGAARLFAKENRMDSALLFANECLAMAKASKLTAQQLDASNFIEAIFESKKQADSALKYLKLTIVLQDSLFSREKSKEIQTMTLQENIRQRNLELQKQQAKENAVKNIQLIAIALFIPVFFLIVVFLARVHVKARVIEFLAVVNLLLLFEFITDIAFPYISDWTHDSPAWEMLILVLIAALLEPINYRIERWVKVKLARKPATAVN
jgi:tetratricopeptide (TPR) repeat protein